MSTTIANIEHACKTRGLIRKASARSGMVIFRTQDGDGFAETAVIILPREGTIEVQARPQRWHATFTVDTPEFVIGTAIETALEA